MRRTFFGLAGLMVAIGIFVAGYLSADCPSDYIPPWQFERYCLFTSNRRDGEVCFALMREFERRKFVRRWFPKRKLECGTNRLKQVLASLPKGTNVLWTNWPDTFDYPEQHVIEDVIMSAAQNDVHVKESPIVK